MMRKLILAGSGHGAVAAYQSLCEFFDEIHVLTSDSDLQNILRVSDHLVSDFDDSDIKLVVCAGYHKIIEKRLLAEKVFINTHPSLLPKYRGMHGLVWAMLNGEREVGFTVHLMNEYLDDGPILAQYKTLDDGVKTSSQFMGEFDQFVRGHLGRVVVDFMDGLITPMPQDRSMATWVPKRNLDDCVVDFAMPGWRMRALFRALVRPYPLPRIVVRNKVFEIIEHEIIDIDYYTTLGRVVNVENDAAYIKTLDGVLVVKKLMVVGEDVVLPASAVLRIGQRL